MNSSTVTVPADRPCRGLVSMPAVALLWLGAVLAIALAAGAKFQAPLLTRTVGLDVGRTVFAAFNRVEIVLAVLATLLALWQREQKAARWALLSAVVALVVQTLVLLPALSARADVIISGGDPGSGVTHISYLVAEGIKITALAIAAHLGLRGHRPTRQETAAS